MSRAAPSPAAPGSLALTCLLTAVTMLAFAANSVLCRAALANTGIDPASFTLLRIGSGALVLGLLLFLRSGQRRPLPGSWRGGLALLGYVACFSCAYLSLSAGTGALLLFGAVQATMILAGLLRGERLSVLQTTGLLLALGGLGWLLAPGVSAPPPGPSLLMLLAGISWGLYSLLGRGITDPLGATAGNFIRASLPALLLAGVWAVLKPLRVDLAGLGYALLSGAVASGLGYALWYRTLRGLTAVAVASVQLSVPVITAFAGALLLGESPSLRLILAALAILGGIALVITGQARRLARR